MMEGSASISGKPELAIQVQPSPPASPSTASTFSHHTRSKSEVIVPELVDMDSVFQEVAPSTPVMPPAYGAGRLPSTFGSVPTPLADFSQDDEITNYFDQPQIPHLDFNRSRPNPIGSMRLQPLQPIVVQHPTTSATFPSLTTTNTSALPATSFTTPTFPTPATFTAAPAIDLNNLNLQVDESLQPPPAATLSSTKRVGISASGGGIRSASFFCGVLNEFVRHPDWKDVEFMSCVSGGGYCGSAFADWSYHEGPTVDPATWIDRFTAQMKKNSGYMFSFTNWYQGVGDIFAFMAMIVLLVFLFIINYAPSGVLLCFLLDLVFGEILRGTSTSMTLGGLIFIIAIATLGVWITKAILSFINNVSNQRVLPVVNLAAGIQLLLLCSLLLLGSFWVEIYLRSSVVDELIQASLIVSWVLALGVPWVMARTFSLQSGFFLLCTAYGRILVWKVNHNTLLYVLPYSDSLWQGLVICSAAIIFLSPWIQPFKNNVLHVYYRWRLQRAFYHRQTSGTFGCSGMLPIVVGCHWLYGWFTSCSRGTTLDDVKNVRPQYIASSTSQLWKAQSQDLTYDVFEMTSNHVGRLGVPENVVDPRRLALSQVMATSGAALAFNLGSFGEEAGFSTMLTATGMGLGQWFATRPASRRPYVVLSMTMYIAEAVLMIIASLVDVNTAKVLCVIAYVIVGLFFAASFFIDGLTYAPIVRSMRNALQLYRIGTDPAPNHIYVTDGAHFENQGVLPLLARQCDQIIICDSSDDPKEEFADIFNVLELGRRKLQCSFRPKAGSHSLDVESLMLNDFRANKDILHLEFEVQYSNGKIGEIIVLKPREPSTLTRANVFTKTPGLTQSLNGCCCICCHTPSASWTKSLCGAFPFHSTAHQFFTPNMFDAYWKLGKMAFRDAFALPLLAEAADEVQVDIDPSGPSVISTTTPRDRTTPRTTPGSTPRDRTSGTYPPNAHTNGSITPVLPSHSGNPGPSSRTAMDPVTEDVLM